MLQISLKAIDLGACCVELRPFNCSKIIRLPNLVVITLLENYDYFVHTLDTIGNQWEIFVYRFDLPVTSFYNNDICEKFMISMNFGDWIHRITHCSMI